MSHYTYAFGYKTRADAEAALEDMFAAGEVSPGEKPIIESYSLETYGLKRREPIRYCIKLES